MSERPQSIASARDDQTAVATWWAELTPERVRRASMLQPVRLPHGSKLRGVAFGSGFYLDRAMRWWLVDGSAKECALADAGAILGAEGLRARFDEVERLCAAQRANAR